MLFYVGYERISSMFSVFGFSWEVAGVLVCDSCNRNSWFNENMAGYRYTSLHQIMLMV